MDMGGYVTTSDIFRKGGCQPYMWYQRLYFPRNGQIYRTEWTYYYDSNSGIVQMNSLSKPKTTLSSVEEMTNECQKIKNDALLQ